ncbi:ankyrin repeat domain-containing protein [bacterium]|nr:ankyrin repeat domain-containing protein [bacterium]
MNFDILPKNITALGDTILENIVYLFDNKKDIYSLILTCKRFFNILTFANLEIKQEIFEFYLRCRNGKIFFPKFKIIKRLFRGKDRADPTTDDNISLLTACRKGSDKLVKYFLDYKPPIPPLQGRLKLDLSVHKRVDPTANDNYALKWAMKNGHYKVLKLLLEYKPPLNSGYKRVDFTIVRDLVFA